MLIEHKRLLVLALAALLTAGLSGCGDDDDDDGTGTDADTDADSDSDSDTDSDTDVTYDGVLNGQIMGAGVQVWVQFSTDLEITWSIRYWATDGNVNNIEVTEVRVWMEDEVFFTIPQSSVLLNGMEFNGIVEKNTEKTISYKYTSTQQQGFHEHCTEVIEFEIDVSYNAGETLDTLSFGGTPTDNVVCTEG
jgi:hypothetical protein